MIRRGRTPLLPSPTGSGRLPDFVVLGSPRSGTTTIADWLRAHPDVRVPEKKEVHYFTRFSHLGLDWYRAHFEGPERLAGEATPLYLHEQSARRAIAETLPESRFVVVLREPVSRAWSHYHLNRMIGLEPRAFVDALRDEGRDSANRPASLPAGRPEDATFRYLGCGRYARDLADLFNLVDRERVLVLLLDDLVASPDDTFRLLCRHIGAREVPRPTTGPSHKGGQPRSPRLQRWIAGRSWVRWPFGLGRRLYLDWNIRPGYPILPEDIRRELVEEFRADNQRLAELLDRELPSRWGTGPGQPG